MHDIIMTFSYLRVELEVASHSKLCYDIVLYNVHVYMLEKPYACSESISIITPSTYTVVVYNDTQGNSNFNIRS